MTDMGDSVAPEAANSAEQGENESLTLEAQLSKLRKEKRALEADFGVKRAKFKELFLQKEAELKQERDRQEQCKAQLDKQQAEMSMLRQELEGVRMAAAMSEQAKSDEVASIREHYEQEISSMQQLLGEASEEAQMSTAAQYETERMNLVKLNEKYEEEIQDLRNKLSQEREGFLVSVAKSLKRVGGVSGSSSPNISSEHENLEDSMRKAQEDAQVLKSVVLPLEEEIKTLKEQLRQAQLKLQAQGAQAKNGDKSSPTLSDVDSVTDPKEKIDKLLKIVKGEKAARMDLEMYVAVLTTQKNVLQEDTDKVRKELHEVCRLLEEEKQAHEMLKQTWQMANDQFLESQRLIMMDLRRMESVLSSEQQRQIAEMQQKDQEREALDRKVKELGEKRERQEREQAERRKQSFSQSAQQSQESSEPSRDELTPSDKLKSQSKGSLTSANSDEIGQFDVLDSGSLHRAHSSSELRGANGDQFADSGVHETRSLCEADGMTIRISPEKVLTLPSASLTAAQTKAITDPTPEVEARRTLLAVAKAKSEQFPLEGKRLVSEREWHLLQEEIRSAREKLGRPCSMCSNYEAQLQTSQEDVKTCSSENKRLERLLASERQATEKSLKYQSQLEETLKASAEETETQISTLTTKLQECEKYLTEIKQSFTQSQLQLQDQLKSLTENREHIQRELTKLQDENDNLVGKHSKTAQQLQNEDINLPNNLEEMQLLLLKYREEIIAAKVAKEHGEETLKSEQVFLRSQLLSEQEEKQRMEDTLSQEISALQAKANLLDKVKADLERESAARAEVETKYRESEASLKSIQAKSKQLIGALQQRVEEAEMGKVKNTRAEEEAQKLRSKIQSLQVDLDNSEAVQRDFVKLSQSLQIQLEKIRQAENEVRWQHEDDVEDCNNCRQSFSVTRRKHHCRHCGRIFCADCTTKTVNSGPNGRAAKVCDVCHTILVKDATPYFSTEPPATPD